MKLAADLDVGEVYVQRLVFNGLGLAIEGNALHGRLQALEQDLLREAAQMAEECGLALRASGLTTPLASLTGAGPRARPWAGCQRPWTLAYVTANGNVLPCCISPWVTRDYRALVLGNVVIQSGRCYTLFVMREGTGTFLAFGQPGIPPGQLVRLNTPAGRKMRGRIFYLVAIHTTAVLVPVNTISMVAVRAEDYGPRVAIVLVGVPAPNVTVVFSARL